MRRLLSIAVLLALALLPAGCAKDQAAPDAPESEDVIAATQGTPAPDATEAMPTDGPGETSAVATLPDALEQARQQQESAGAAWVDVSDIDPLFTAYVVAAEMNGQVALFEVRADGIAHSLYAYHKAFDAATMVWTPADMAGAPKRAAQSDAERAAVAAVQSAMQDSFPDAPVSVGIYGYRFVYAEGGIRVLVMEVATDGSVISAGP